MILNSIAMRPAGLSPEIRHKYRGRAAEAPSSGQTAAAAMTMFSISILAVLLLLLPPRADGAATPTYWDTDPQTGEQVECDRCRPGTYLSARCTATQKSVCAPCPSGSFTELWNYIGKCLRCGVCGPNQMVKRPCTAESDCECQCQQGFYYRSQSDMCRRHTECPAGHGVLSEGTADEDTKCQVCPDGTFSDVASAQGGCVEHRSCEASGLKLLLNGSTWHDSVCTGCRAHEFQDAADYLREILPAFFLHQNMHSRRFRSLVQQLRSEAGRRTNGTPEDLHKQIRMWANSTTAAHIRQLPVLLKKLRSNRAAEKLEKKLQRMEAQLKQACSLSNEVDDTPRSA